VLLEELRGRLGNRHLALRISDAATDLLAREGYDPTFGARPLRRTLRRRLQDPIAAALLSGRYHEGDEIQVDVGPAGDLTLSAGAPAADPAATGS
jgi:ATP-dependent Clp protease ATP-binding subunit ClpB